MKHLHFDVETAGFYGAYWACKTPSNCAMIAMIEMCIRDSPMLVRHVLSQLSYAHFVSLSCCSPQRRGSLYTLAPGLSTPFFAKIHLFFAGRFVFQSCPSA